MFASQAKCRGFEPHLPLQIFEDKYHDLHRVSPLDPGQRIVEESQNLPLSSTQSRTKVEHVGLGFLTVTQAAQALGVSAITVSRWCESGKLSSIAKPYGRKVTYLISPQAVELVKVSLESAKVKAQKRKLEDSPHSAYVSRWVAAMAKGTLTGKVFSQRTINDYKRYTDLYFSRYHRITADNLKTELMRIPSHQFAKREHCYKAMLSLGRFLIREGCLDKGFVEQVKPLYPKRHLPPKRTTVDEQGLVSLLDACESVQDRLIITLLSQTGLRASEACALKWSDIDTDNAILTVRLGKGGKTRRVGLSTIAMAALQKTVESRQGVKPSSNVLLNDLGKAMTPSGLYQRVERIGSNAGVPASPHALRRAFVTINAQKGKPLPILQRACGHSDVKTTMAYCQIAEQEVIDAMKDW